MLYFRSASDWMSLKSPNAALGFNSQTGNAYNALGMSALLPFTIVTSLEFSNISFVYSNA